MRLPQALHAVLDRYGRELLSEERLLNFLADYGAFDERATRRVMQTFLGRGQGQQMLVLDRRSAPERDLPTANICAALVREGYQQRHVRYVIESVSYALGWMGELPELPDPSDEEKAGQEFGLSKHIVRVGPVTFALVYVAGGRFDIGATPEQGLCAAFDEKPSVQVRVSSFFLAETPVTQALWTHIMGDNPSHFQGPERPVERVTWEECQTFVQRLSAETGIDFRLPTEAEWEYAARGGSRSHRTMYAGADERGVDDCVWHKENSQGATHDVKGGQPNELGLFDMCGNVSEWCADWYFNSYAGSAGRTDPKGPGTGTARVHRGGSWNDRPTNCRTSKRFSMSPAFRNKQVGLRVAVTEIP